jgi:excisionase family DNA binding protein
VAKKQVAVASATAIVPRLLSVKEAATYLGATVWQVRTLVWGKKLVALRMGHRQVFDKCELDAFVEKLKRAS